MYNTAKYIYDNFSIPDKDILHLVSRYDAAETLNCPGKWPRSFLCDVQKCPKGRLPITTLIFNNDGDGVT